MGNDNDFVPDFLKNPTKKQPVMNDLFSVLADDSATEEPTLVDIDEYGNEIAGSKGIPAWKLPKGEFCQEAFDACHIKHWGTKQQRSRWTKIISEMFSAYGQEIKIRRAWIASLIDWAKQKNAGRIVTVIQIDGLMTAIQNDSLYEEFKAKYFKKGTAV